MELALALGKTKKELLSDITSHEITEWQEFFEIKKESDWRERGEGLEDGRSSQPAGKSWC